MIRTDESLLRILEGLAFAMDESGRIVYVNEDCVKDLGTSREELFHRHAAELFADTYRFESIEAWASAVKKPPLMLRGASGPFALRDYKVAVCKDSEGSTYYVVSVSAELRNRNPALIQRFMGDFLQHANLGILLLDLNFCLVAVSDMACQVLGVRREEVLGKHMDDVFAGVPEEYRMVERTLLEGNTMKNRAISWTVGGERYELLVDSNLLQDPEGNPLGAYVIFKDVSNLRSLEQQVQRSDRLAMIGQIAAGTAHEIRNPLTSIKGFLQMLKKTLDEHGMVKEVGFAQLMLMEIDRINELVNEFLLLSKPRNTVLTKVDVGAVIREILPIIHNEAILYGVTVTYHAKSDLPPVIADREMLKQVFLNICKNGIEAMEGTGGTLTVTEKISMKEQKLNVHIKDTGPGVPAFLIDKIFDPFFTTKEEGTGLGLAVCQRIVHDLGGTIRVSSKGFGTTFTVSIPFSAS